MKILVTGATGYIGGRLIPRLLDQGHSVRVLVRDSSRIAGRPWSGRVAGTGTGGRSAGVSISLRAASSDQAPWRRASFGCLTIR